MPAMLKKTISLIILSIFIVTASQMAAVPTAQAEASAPAVSYISVSYILDGINAEVPEGTSLYIPVKTKKTFTAVAYDNSGSQVKAKFKWKSSKSKIAKVSNGKITMGKTAGSAVITVTEKSSGIQRSFTVTSERIPAYIYITDPTGAPVTDTSYGMPLSGGPVQFYATVHDSNGVLLDVPVVWTVLYADPPGAFTVSQSGLITPVSTGWGDVRVTYGDLVAGFGVNVLE